MEKQIEVENLENKRLRWIAINLIGFIIWDGMRIFRNHILPGEAYPILFIIEIIGWMIWVISLIGIIRASNYINKNENLKKILNDEYIILNRLKSWRIGFISLLFTQVIIFLIGFETTISGQLSAEVSIFIGVVSALLSFLYYHR